MLVLTAHWAVALYVWFLCNMAVAMFAIVPAVIKERKQNSALWAAVNTDDIQADVELYKNEIGEPLFVIDESFNRELAKVQARNDEFNRDWDVICEQSEREFDRYNRGMG